MAVTCSSQCSVTVIGVLLALNLAIALGNNDIRSHCPDYKPQNSLIVEKVMGKWYAVEIIQHNRVREPNQASLTIDVCPVLTMNMLDETTIKMLWNEKAGNILYIFRIPDEEKLSFWVSAGSQNGTLVDESYKQFTGTVQVMKAVNSHLVLTFCSRSENMLYTVVLSRTRRLDYAEIRGVNNMLERRRLPLGYVQETCKGAGASLTNISVLAAVTWLSIILWSRSH